MRFGLVSDCIPETNDPARFEAKFGCLVILWLLVVILMHLCIMKIFLQISHHRLMGEVQCYNGQSSLADDTQADGESCYRPYLKYIV